MTKSHASGCQAIRHALNNLLNQSSFSTFISSLTYLQYSHSPLVELAIIDVLSIITEHVYSDDRIVLMLIQP